MEARVVVRRRTSAWGRGVDVQPRIEFVKSRMILYVEILHADFFAMVWVLLVVIFIVALFISRSFSTRILGQYHDLDRLVILLEARASRPTLHSRVAMPLLPSDDNPLSLLVLPMRTLKLVSLAIIVQIVALRRAKEITSFKACGF